MRDRLRKASAWIAGASSGAARLIETGDVLVLIGFGLLIAGLWPLSHALALGIPGGILVLWALPPRPPFIERPPKKEPR